MLDHATLKAHRREIAMPMGRDESSSQPLSEEDLRALRGSKFAPLPAPPPLSRAQPRLAHPAGPMTTNKAAALAKFLERKLQQPGGLNSIDPNLLEVAVKNAKETVNASTGGASNSTRVVRHVASFGDSSEVYIYSRARGCNALLLIVDVYLVEYWRRSRQNRREKGEEKEEKGCEKLRKFQECRADEQEEEEEEEEDQNMNSFFAKTAGMIHLLVDLKHPTLDMKLTRHYRRVLLMVLPIIELFRWPCWGSCCF